jgi:hypothetical protein
LKDGADPVEHDLAAGSRAVFLADPVEHDHCGS